MSNKVKWKRGPHGKKIVTLPDGSKITTEILQKKLGIHRVSATNKLNAYIETGDLERLWKVKQKNERKPYTKKEVVEQPITHYCEGDLKHYYDPSWKILMQNI